MFQAFNKRVHPMVGNVALFELGLKEENYAYLTYEVRHRTIDLLYMLCNFIFHNFHSGCQIDYIVHAAASVNLIYPYEALKGPNVIGTQNVLLFSRTGKIKPVHYISTNAVFPNNMVSQMFPSFPFCHMHLHSSDISHMPMACFHRRRVEKSNGRTFYKTAKWLATIKVVESFTWKISQKNNESANLSPHKK